MTLVKTEPQQLKCDSICARAYVCVFAHVCLCVTQGPQPQIGSGTVKTFFFHRMEGSNPTGTGTQHPLSAQPPGCALVY